MGFDVLLEWFCGLLGVLLVDCEFVLMFVFVICWLIWLICGDFILHLSTCGVGC